MAPLKDTPGYYTVWIQNLLLSAGMKPVMRYVKNNVLYSIPKKISLIIN